MLEDQPMSNQPAFPPQAPNALGGRPAEDMFAEVDRSGPRPAAQPVNFGAPSYQAAPQPTAAPAASLNTLPNQPAPNQPLTFDQPPAQSHAVKFLLIGLGSLVVILVAGIYVYQQFLAPRLAGTTLPLDAEANTEQTADQNTDSQNNQFIMDEEPIINNTGDNVDNNQDLLTADDLLQEATAGANATQPNTDNVTTPEADLPADMPTSADSDGDGLTDQEEQNLGTNRLVVDSDSDGLSDKEEVKFYYTNPLDPDTDGDTYLDGQEVQAGYNPNGAGKLLVP